MRCSACLQKAVFGVLHLIAYDNKPGLEIKEVLLQEKLALKHFRKAGDGDLK